MAAVSFQDYEALDFEAIKEAALSLQKQDSLNLRIFQEQKTEIERLTKDSLNLDRRITAHQTLKIKEDAKLKELSECVQYLQSNQQEFPDKNSDEKEHKIRQNLESQIQKRINRNDKIAKVNARNAQEIKEMEDEMQRNEQFLKEYMSQLHRFGEMQSKFSQQFVLQGTRKLMLYFDRTNGTKKESNLDSEVRMMEEFILKAEMQKMEKINALNQKTITLQQQCIAELNTIDIPQLDGSQDLEIGDGIESIDATQKLSGQTENEDEGDEETEDEEDGNKEDGNEFETETEHKEQGHVEQSLLDKVESMKVDDPKEDEQDTIMQEMANKNQRDQMLERYLSDSELNNDKDPGNTISSRHRAFSQRSTATTLHLPDLSPLPLGLSQTLSPMPVGEALTEKQMVDDQRKSYSQQPGTAGDLNLMSLSKKAVSAEPPSKSENHNMPDLC